MIIWFFLGVWGYFFPVFHCGWFTSVLRDVCIVYFKCPGLVTLCITGKKKKKPKNKQLICVKNLRSGWQFLHQSIKPTHSCDDCEEQLYPLVLGKHKMLIICGKVYQVLCTWIMILLTTVQHHVFRLGVSDSSLVIWVSAITVLGKCNNTVSERLVWPSDALTSPS